MVDTLRIKRRALGGAAGAPASLAVGELAFNEVDGLLYIGRSNSTVIPINSGGGGAGVTISDTPPASPTSGQLWWESDTGKLWLSYNDGTSTQWVLVNSPPSAAPVLTSKKISFTRQMNFPSATIAYTGVGFQPTSVIIIGATGAISNLMTVGIADSARASAAVATFGASTHYISGVLVNLWEASGVGQSAVLASYDPDGFSLTWTASGSPTTNVVTLHALCLR